LRERAVKLHRQAIVIDTHNDITSAITDRGFDMGVKDASGGTQTDIPRMKEGGLDADFFAIYVAASYGHDRRRLRAGAPPSRIARNGLHI
jgi:membrane dipeptidase